MNTPQHSDQATANASYRLAIVPYINSTEEKKGYIQEIVDGKYTEHYSSKNFQSIPSEEVQKALNSTGYDNSNQELAEKDKVSSFQVTGLSENKTVFGDVGYKDPITKALDQAMDDANEKIKSNL
ncbi:hypothetical protein [Pelosinus propionicus]|uniref:Uncharacterized protein n=1 Tax=Pelosinus propionicus DSM 13327 TaxID=1123291 RepID=A0A1I4PWH2_9FIRM|nr:hypothetical protein [Pelosinus propionicus]SFM31803.1 hypothetical protein SAMN04490355_10747 [Pelosinus propionicus DSM 13327]